MLYKTVSSEYDLPGHAYAELIDLDKIDEEPIVQGFYRKGYKKDHERLKYAKAYQASHPQEKILFSKAFDIDEESANKILAAMPSYNSTSNEVPLGIVVESYKIFQNNCSDYVNALFRLTGLPGLYSWYLTSKEAREIPGIVRGYIFAKMGPGDKEQIVKGNSKEEIAEKYNIDISLISKKESEGILVPELAMLQEVADMFSYVIARNPALVSSYAEAEYISESDYLHLGEAEKQADIGLKNSDDESFVETLGANIAISELIGNPENMAAYQEQCMQMAMQNIDEADRLIPGLGSDILTAAKATGVEYGELLASIMPSEANSSEAKKAAKEIAKDAEEILSTTFARADFGYNTNTSERGRTENQENPDNSPADTAEATVDFVNSILSASTISDSDIAGARQIVEATPPMDDMLANPDIQDFLSAFSIPDINNMMGQNFDPDEGQDA